MMKKGLVRWTIGNVNSYSYDVLHMSVRNFLKIYQDRFNYIICHNNTTNYDKLRKISETYNVPLYQQTFLNAPFPQTKKDNNCIWKYCPARLSLTTHEIFLDNDVVFLKECDYINEFLESEKTLMVEDYVKYQGRYRHLFNLEDKFNAGILGVPPYFDLSKEMINVWKANESMDNLNPGDEQGLVTYVLRQFPHIIINKEDAVLTLAEGKPVNVEYLQDLDKSSFTCEEVHFTESICHFASINRVKYHRHWLKYLSNLYL
jgi:hypothetical protein